MTNIKVTPLDDQGKSLGTTFNLTGHITKLTADGVNLFAKAIDPFRGTGRTSKMLWEAACAKDQGERVLIVVHQESMIRYCLGESMRGAWWGLEPGDFVTVEQAYQKVRGSGGLVRHFIDHAVYDAARGSTLILRCLREVEDAIRMARVSASSYHWSKP